VGPGTYTKFVIGTLLALATMMITTVACGRPADTAHHQDPPPEDTAHDQDPPPDVLQSSRRHAIPTQTRIRAEIRSCLYFSQQEVKEFYLSSRVQVCVATLIFFNFLVQCLEKQIDPGYKLYPRVWMVIADCFNVIFIIELAINMYGSWMRPFFRSGWNVFDTIVVTIGILDLAKANLPGPLTMLRMLRAFRVFRLFNRIASLRKLVDSLRRAVPGVCHAFAINLLMMCIYAVLSVEFFRNLHQDCELPPGSSTMGAFTARAKCFGEDYFGNFLRSMYTLFQVLTGESWSEAVVRPILHYFDGSPWETMGVALFFISFILINAVVLLNVVVAVLLDGMKEPPPPKPQASEKVVDLNASGPQSEVEALRAEVAALSQDLDMASANLREQIAAVINAMEAMQPVTQRC